MKQYALNFVPTILLGVFVNHFFSGFVVGRLPFPLPASFKALLHGGIYLPELDTCFLSSLSWYILSLVGLRSVASLLVFDYSVLDRPAPSGGSSVGVPSLSAPSAAPPVHQAMLASMLTGGMPMGGAMGAGAGPGAPPEEQQMVALRDALHAENVWTSDTLDNVEMRLMRDFA